eukprot:scaffold30095_cov53-Cyclotella_meneghiniana.AAC.1
MNPTLTIIQSAAIAVTIYASIANAAFVPQVTTSHTRRRHHGHRASFVKTNIKSSRRTSSHLHSTTAQDEPSSPLPQLKLYNSLTRSKDPFIPISPPQISMYTCGPTVYDYAHVGNFRAFLTYDVLKRVLLYLGYNVHHVCNLTDVDDKIIKRCQEQNLTLLELTRKYEQLFFDDLKALNIVPATHYPRATDHIEDMAQFILDLESNGLAYQSDEGSWYFNVEKKEGYGTKLVQLDPEAMQKTGMAGSQRGGGVDADEYDSDKEGIRDFCLWKSYKPNFDREDSTWDPIVTMNDGTTRSIGKGRPGWHLECSAMARRYLGNTIDLHAGGIDLKFPHHENEIAQSEVVSSQYRNPLSFTEKALNAAKGALKRLDKVKLQIDEALTSHNGEDVTESESAIAAVVEKELANFEVAITDDLSMPRASASLFSIVKAAEIEFKRINKTDKDGNNNSNNSSLDMYGLKQVQQALQQMDKVFGVYYTVPSANGEGDIKEETETSVPDEVMELVMQRTAAKEMKDWELADSLRAKITELGFVVKDVKGGNPIVSKVVAFYRYQLRHRIECPLQDEVSGGLGRGIKPRLNIN